MSKKLVVSMPYLDKDVVLAEVKAQKQNGTSAFHTNKFAPK